MPRLILSIIDIIKSDDRKRINAFTINIRGISDESKCDRIRASATLSPRIALAKQINSSMKNGILYAVNFGTGVCNDFIVLIKILQML